MTIPINGSSVLHMAHHEPLDDNMGHKFMVEFYSMFREAVYNSKTIDEFEERRQVVLIMSRKSDNL